MTKLTMTKADWITLILMKEGYDTPLPSIKNRLRDYGFLNCDMPEDGYIYAVRKKYRDSIPDKSKCITFWGR